jgi:hypothetical protein
LLLESYWKMPWCRRLLIQEPSDAIRTKNFNLFNRSKSGIRVFHLSKAFIHSLRNIIVNDLSLSRSPGMPIYCGPHQRDQSEFRNLRRAIRIGSKLSVYSHSFLYLVKLGHRIW